MSMLSWRRARTVVRFSGPVLGCIGGFSLSQGELVIGAIAMLLCVAGLVFFVLGPRRMRGQQWILPEFGRVAVNDVVQGVGVTFWPVSEPRHDKWIVISEEAWEEHARRVQ